MDRGSRFALRVVVGGYLIYLGWSLISGQMAGDTGMSDLLAYGSGAVLALSGGAFALYAIREFRRTGSGSQPPREEEEEAEHE